MKCELVEQLIPLHIGGDLEPSESESLRRHLATCARCRQLHEEFEASRVWLREMAAPDFDAAVYADLRSTVIRQIKQQEKRGSWFQWLLPKWDSKLMLAASAAALAVVTGLMAVTYYHQPTPATTVPSGSETLANQDRHEKSDAGTRTFPTLSEKAARTEHSRFLAPRPQPNAAARTEPAQSKTDTALPPEAFGNDPFVASSGEPATISDPADTTPAEPEEEKEMLRIELQTADPKIKIIWLTPKSAPARPDTK